MKLYQITINGMATSFIYSQNQLSDLGLKIVDLISVYRDSANISYITIEI